MSVTVAPMRHFHYIHNYYLFSDKYINLKKHMKIVNEGAGQQGRSALTVQLPNNNKALK